MQNNTEPEERQQPIIDADYNPLDEPVNEKSYSQANISASIDDLNKPIDEPRFTPPPLQKPKPVLEQEEVKREPINPEMRKLPKKETEMAASHMAKIIIQGYEWAHVFANKGLQVSEKKLNKLQAEGEINLNAMIDYDYGKKIRAGDFFVEYNEQVGSVLTVSEEFKQEVTPVLEKVLAKRGVGLTDEQMLMYMFGKDIATKGMIFFQQKSQLNHMIQSIKEATTSQYHPAPPPPPPQQQAKQHQQTAQEAQAEFDAQSAKEEEFAPKKEALKPDIIVLPKKGRGRPAKDKSVG